MAAEENTHVITAGPDVGAIAVVPGRAGVQSTRRRRTGRAASIAAARASAGALVVACRPRQWVKNGLVFAAAASAGTVGHWHVLRADVLALAALCMAASSTYLVNDVANRRQDRLHPSKRNRPIAAGRLGVTAALVAAVAIGAGSLGVAFLARPLVVAVVGGYLALTFSYTAVWRQLPVLDLLAISAGFFLRALAGGVAAQAPLSRWFVLVVALGAIMVAAGKRHAELIAQTPGVPATRRVLRTYSRGGLTLLYRACAGGVVVAYLLWALRQPDWGGFPWFELTLLPLSLWLVRYVRLLDMGTGQAPEELVLRDRVLLALTGAWLIAFALGVYVGR